LTGGEIAARYVASLDAPRYVEAMEALDIDILPAVAQIVRPVDDAEPDGPCEITRWLEQQFKGAA
jgi:hypothetical protein